VRLMAAWPLFGFVLFVTAPRAQETAPAVDAVIRELQAGNQHHVTKRYQHPHQTATRQRELVSTQRPHAAVLTCADSRVAPEIVFDQGLGDLFDVRVAGNIAGDAEVASIEYAAEHLDVPLVVVMGHQRCGAVTAALEAGEAHGHLPTLLAAIRPAVEQARGLSGDHVEIVVRLNVENVVTQLRTSKPVLAGLVEKGRLRIVGAVYSLDTGKVDWLPQTTAVTAVTPVRVGQACVRSAPGELAAGPRR